MLAMASFAQNSVVRETNGRVTVRDTNDSILVEIEPIGSDAVEASFNNDQSEIMIIYVSGKVLVKQPDGTNIVQIAEEDVTDKAISAVWQGDAIVITTQSNQSTSKNCLEWRQ